MFFRRDYYSETERVFIIFLVQMDGLKLMNFDPKLTIRKPKIKLTYFRGGCTPKDRDGCSTKY